MPEHSPGPWLQASQLPFTQQGRACPSGSCVNQYELFIMGSDVNCLVTSSVWVVTRQRCYMLHGAVGRPWKRGAPGKGRGTCPRPTGTICSPRIRRPLIFLDFGFFTNRVGHKHAVLFSSQIVRIKYKNFFKKSGGGTYALRPSVWERWRVSYRNTAAGWVVVYHLTNTQ